MVVPYDNLDSMMWTVGLSAAIIGILLLKIRYDSKTQTIEDSTVRDRIGYILTLGGGGLYLLVSGLYIYFTWPFGSPYGSQFTTGYVGGYNNVLFGGVATMGGLLLIMVALALYFNGGFKMISYFGVGVGFYALAGAAAILVNMYGKTPIPSALGYIGLAAAAFFIVPVAHSNNKNFRYLAALFAFLFAAVWLFEGFNTTMSHLGAPVM